ncbi:uncharacterized protein LOC128397441 [Panonychus citri]|uniref:uncharacterized protein LOC128397441 n=1 Tax=Panonychus citri TaxID=50023 RepID=UPI002307DBF3|nr:uncharacterized protein LOC128397441 [Panonychus citri]
MAQVMLPSTSTKQKGQKRIAKKKPPQDEDIEISIDLPKVVKETEMKRKIDEEMRDDDSETDGSTTSSASSGKRNRRNETVAAMEMDLFNIPGNRNKRPSSDFNVQNQFRVSDNLVFFTSSTYSGIRTGKIRKYWLKDGKHQVSAYGGEMLKADIPKFVSWLQKPMRHGKNDELVDWINAQWNY